MTAGNHEPDERCNAVKTDGSLCKNRAGHATSHPGVGRCGSHGGRSPTHDKALNLERIRQRARAYGDEKNIDPLSALLEEIRWTAGHCEWLRERIAEKRDDDSIVKGQRSLLAQYRGERAHLVKATEAAIRLGIADRVVRLREEETTMLVSITFAAAEAVGLLPDQRRALMKAIAAEIRGRGGPRRVALPAIPPPDPIIETTIVQQDSIDDVEPDREPPFPTAPRATVLD